MDVTWLTTPLTHASGNVYPAPLASGEPAGISATQIVLLVLAIVCLTSLMLSTRRRLRKQRHMPQTSIRERYTELKDTEEATRDMEQAMLQLDQLSRQIHGRLDTKLARLEAVIRDADKRIATLSRLAAPSGAQRGLEITLDEERPRDAATFTDDNRHTLIHRLADQGLTPVDIAERTGRTTGEIELILSLRRTISNVPPPGRTAPAEAAS